jgi:hypothetical protein
LRGELRDLLEEIVDRLDRIESAQSPAPMPVSAPPIASEHGLHQQ